jgi:phytoene dehydrogenase-like protein
MNERFEAIVVGAGHNGLTCAAYLAKAGRRVLVLEAAARVGGAARTREFAPGFRSAACAHLLHALHPAVWRELRLRRHGLRLAARGLATVALTPGGEAIHLDGNKAEGVAPEDAAAYPAFRRQMLRFAQHLQPLLAVTPPRLGTTDWADRRTLMRLGWAIRSLGRDDMRAFLRVAAMNVADLLDERFASDALKGALAFDAVLGSNLGPRSPTSVLPLLYRLTGRIGRQQGALALPRGGMGAVTEALAKAATAAGAVIRTKAAVERILVNADRAAGVVLDSGETIAADIVVSNADPKRTFLDLLGPTHLDTGFLRRVRNVRTRGTVAKLDLALDGLPAFTGLDERDLGQRLLLTGGMTALEAAFNPAKYGGVSERPALEIVVPTLHDPALAPDDQHVLSALAIYLPYDLRGGWDPARDRVAEALIDRIAEVAPDIRQRIVAKQLQTPADLESRFGLTGGHWHHGELAFDQLFMLRPVPGAAQYATPLPGLYLCGAGTHPGGGVSGIPGRNAARRIVADQAVRKTPAREQAA